MIFSAPHLILPPEKPAIVRASDLRNIPSWKEMRRREQAMKEATFPFPMFVPGGIGGNDAFTTLLLHCDGANASTSFPDASATANTVTANGAAQVATAQSKFGGASASFNNSASSYLSAPNNTALQFGTGDFTIDGWVYINTLKDYNTLASRRAASGVGWVLFINSIGALRWSDNTNASDSADTLTAGAWHHVAWSRSGSNNYLFINGGVPTTFSNSTNFNGTESLLVGLDGNGMGFPMNGYIDEFRISKGIARWTAAFTPPTQPYS